MSKIEKLSIQGIRSFGPDVSKRIDFFSPLTLIQGQNGCGKTTIIESLKYITTGEVPPGCGKGASFVHDPKLAMESVVRGQIKLLFRNRKGQKVVATRSVEVTQKAKKLECKTLDATLTISNANGEKHSISNKCADFQLEMTSFLGVSKAILENVIFCHQEDCNWPLDEGKKVKNKFDAIFNATKYIKCLDSIRKLRKDKKQMIHNMKETVAALKSCKDYAASLKRELRGVEKDYDSIEKDQEELKNVKIDVGKKLIEIINIEKEINTYTSDLKYKQNHLNSLQASKNELKTSQSETFTCSDIELMQMIKEFEQNTNFQLDKQNRYLMNMQMVEKDIDSKKREESSALKLVGNYEAAHRVHIENIKKLNKFFTELVSRYDLYKFQGREEFSTTDSNNILIEISNQIDKENKNLHKIKLEFENKDKYFHLEIDKLKSLESKYEHDQHLCTEQLDQLVCLIREAQQKLSIYENDLSLSNLDDIKQSINRMAEKIKEEENRVDTSQLSREIDQLKKDELAVESELNETKNKISNMNKQIAQRSELDLHIKNRKKIESQIKIMKNRNAEDLQMLFKNPVDSNLRNELDAKLSNIRREITDIRDKTNKLNKTKTELEMKINNNKKTIAQKDEDIRLFEDQLTVTCHGNDLDSALDKCKEQMNVSAKTKGDCESSLVMFKGFLNKLKVGEACPLCHRDFDQSYHVNMLVEEIDNKLNNLPQRLSQINTELRMHETNHEKLLQLKPHKDIAQKAREEVDQLKKLNAEYYKELDKVDDEIESFTSLLGCTLMEEQCAYKLTPDIHSIDKQMKEIQYISDHIRNIQAMLGDYDDSVSMDELTMTENTLYKRSKLIRRVMEEKREIIMNHNNHIQKLKNRKIDLSTQEMEAKTKQQEIEKLIEKIEELKGEKLKAKQKIDESGRLLAPLKFQINDECEKKSKMNREREIALNKCNKVINDLNNDQRKAKEMFECVKEYIETNQEDKLQQTKGDIENLQTEYRCLELKKRELQEEINKIEKNINNQKERKRNLDDEKKIREKEEESKLLSKEISLLENKISKYNFENISAEKEQLLREQHRVITSLANNEGRLKEVIKKKESLQNNINSKQIKNAEKNFVKKLVEIKCIDIACNDLNKYYKALETAIMKFHNEKMSNINSIIRELWRSTYKGNDIDYVEIKTDESESQGADKRRTYDYRVVMVKNNIEMDMRGRCSSGQKVLASLIIRLALAETFSSNCGILALDEPTTNLDEENIEALSLALLGIINKRQWQTNFQLLVISHDEEFMHKLRRGDSTQFFYKVERDENGLSTILRKNILDT